MKRNFSFQHEARLKGELSSDIIYKPLQNTKTRHVTILYTFYCCS